MIDADYMIHGDYLLTMADGEEPLTDGAAVVKGDKIIDVGNYTELATKYNAKHYIGGGFRLILPGLINTHTHAAMVYFRGIADDMPFRDWLEGYIWPAENRWLSAEFVSDAMELACLEMVRAGITTFCDMYFFEDAAAVIVKEIGMRAVLGRGVLDFPSVSAKTPDEYIESAEEYIKKWNGDELISPSIAPHSPYACGPDTLKKAKKVADKYNAILHTHLSETEWEVNEIGKRYGRSPIDHLENIGVLDNNVLAAHCVWPSDSEMDLLARRKTGVSHCVDSNLKLASGFAPVVSMLDRGVKVCLGTDGAASNNDLDIIAEMGAAARLHKAAAGDPTALNAKQALRMATLSGAEALGLGDKTGSIEKGKQADILIVNMKKPHLLPIYDIFSHIVYSMRSSDVESVMINGEVVQDRGVLVKKSEDEIMDKAIRWNRRIKEETRS